MAKGRRRVAQLKQREGIHLSSFFGFVLVLVFWVVFGPLVDWVMPTYIGEGHRLPSRHAVTGSFRNHIRPALWASLSPVKLTPKNNHHNFSV